MTSKQWAEISIAFDTPPERRTERQRYLASHGLCDARAWISGRYDDSGYQNFCLAIMRFCECRSVFLAPRRCPEGDTLRASLAALFAAMTQSERDEVLGRF